MAKDIEYWNGIPVVRAQPVLSDLQRWQAQRPRADRAAQTVAWQAAGQPSASQRTDAGQAPSRSPR